MDLKTLAVVKTRAAHTRPMHETAASQTLKLHKLRRARLSATAPYRLSSAGFPVANRNSA